MKITTASSLFDRMRGLFGREGAVDVLLLAPCNDIHTFGMSRAIDVAFVASDGRVIEAYRDVRPFRRLKCRRAVVTLERYSRDAPWIEPGETIELKRYVKIWPVRLFGESV